MRKKTKPIESVQMSGLVDQVFRAHDNCVAAAREDETASGGDPTEYDVKRLSYQLAEAEFKAAFLQLLREAEIKH